MRSSTMATTSTTTITTIIETVLPLEGGGMITVLLVVLEAAVEIMDPVRNDVDLVTVEITVVVEVLGASDGVRCSIVDSS